MTILGFLQVHAHYFPGLSMFGAGIFIGLGIGFLWAIDNAGAMP